jgi:EAL domain-containing protein (putative c-di-GMP-specific phosphodiesterase class I)
LQIAPYRLLGFAFANADLLFEVGPDEAITFAVGAAQALAGGAERSLMGRSWREFVDPGDQSLIEALFASADAGGRQGPVTARLARPQAQGATAFSICVCKLPQNQGAISCAASPAAAPALQGTADGLYDRGVFEAVAKSLYETTRATGQQLELALVEMHGLGRAAQGLPKEAQTALNRRIAGVLRAQSHGGSAAARLENDRFALIRSEGEPPDALTRRIARLMSLATELGEVKPVARAMALKGDVPPAQMARAMRYLLDDFIRDGTGADQPSSLEAALNQSVRQTLEKATALGAMVAERRFSLAYQPVVELATGGLNHHEALVRFGDDASPFPTIRMAEELDLIGGLDLAIVEQAADYLAKDVALKLAVNISGRSIGAGGFVGAVQAIVKARPGVADRLMFEITESAAIEDLGYADRQIQILRGLGCEVCLDDFGAGAASLAYLQQLHLDLVKIDGRYIRELQHGGRAATFIRHLVQMCRELKVKTLAEMVETTAAEEAVRLAGVDFAQGYLYGAPAPRPEPPAIRAPTAARRRGVVESWG